MPNHSHSQEAQAQSPRAVPPSLRCSQVALPWAALPWALGKRIQQPHSRGSVRRSQMPSREDQVRNPYRRRAKVWRHVGQAQPWRWLQCSHPLPDPLLLHAVRFSCISHEGHSAKQPRARLLRERTSRLPPGRRECRLGPHSTRCRTPPAPRRVHGTQRVPWPRAGRQVFKGWARPGGAPDREGTDRDPWEDEKRRDPGV